jgi:hypothetical protein
MSITLIRTNTGLSGNCKIIVDSKENLYLDSILSSSELYSNRYQKFSFSKDKLYCDVIPLFFKNTPNEITFSVKNDSKNYIQSTNYSDQYDTTYNNTVKLVENNKYDEEFEAFAPFYIKNDLPKGLHIFKIDGNGIIPTNKENFINSIKNKMKIVQSYNLDNTELGQWIKNSFKEIPTAPLQFSFNKENFTYFNGLDINNGLYTSKALFMGDLLHKNLSYSELENYIFNGYKEKNLAVANLVNLSFLFDDKTSNTWSFNSYFSMYIDEYIMNNNYGISNNNLIFNDDLYIENNILKSTSNKIFKHINKTVIDEKNLFILIDNKFYRLAIMESRGFVENSKIDGGNYTYEEDRFINIESYKVISDTVINIPLIDNYRINKEYISIENNKLIGVTINNYDATKTYFAKIKNRYYSIIEKDGSYFINSDYILNTSIDAKTISYNNINNSFSETLELNDSITIYQVIFTEIGDFDTSIVETDYSNFEYDKENTIVNSDEEKMYSYDYLHSDNVNMMVKENVVNDKLVNIPVTSEYITSSELFSIDKDNLNNLWVKNPTRVKFGFLNSLSQTDYPYLLNNSIFSGSNNRTLNIDEPLPDNTLNNLSFFYSNQNLSEKYLFKSLDLEQEISLPDLVNDIKYFERFLSPNILLSNGIKPQTKWSVFNDSDGFSSNNTLFRGIHFKIYDVETLDTTRDLSYIKKLNTKPSNNYNGYKFSIVASNNRGSYKDGIHNNLILNNSFHIAQIFEFNKEYDMNDYVIYNDMIYIVTNNVTVINGDNPPIINPDFTLIDNTIFWSDVNTYNIGDICFYQNNYYIKTNNTGVPFYSGNISYAANSYVYLNNKIYYSVAANNTCPLFSNTWDIIDEEMALEWELLDLWNNDTVYNTNDYCYHNKMVYKAINPNSTNEPSPSNTDWELIYTFDYKYQISNILDVNNQSITNVKYINKHFYIYDNVIGFDNGIEFYINNDNKTVLCHIYVNDNTIDLELKRNDMYELLYYNYTIHNFLDNISDLNNSTLYNSLRYHIIQNNEITSYERNVNINLLPCYITYDKIDINQINDTYYVAAYKLAESKLNVKLYIKNYIDADTINDYDGQEMYSVIDNKQRVPLKDTYLRRYSGNYEPIIYKLDMFDHNREVFALGNRDFGKIKELIIQKVNHTGTNLKLINDKAIYPILNEFGFMINDKFIFNSRFSNNYYVQSTRKISLENDNSDKKIVKIKIEE